MLARFGAVMQPEIPPAKDETIDTLGRLPQNSQKLAVGALRALLEEKFLPDTTAAGKEL